MFGFSDAIKRLSVAAERHKHNSEINELIGELCEVSPDAPEIAKFGLFGFTKHVDKIDETAANMGVPLGGGLYATFGLRQSGVDEYIVFLAESPDLHVDQFIILYSNKPIPGKEGPWYDDLKSRLVYLVANAKVETARRKKLKASTDNERLTQFLQANTSGSV